MLLGFSKLVWEVLELADADVVVAALDGDADDEARLDEVILDVVCTLDGDADDEARLVELLLDVVCTLDAETDELPTLLMLKGMEDEEAASELSAMLAGGPTAVTL